MTIQAKINTAFAALNEKLIASDQSFAARKRQTVREFIELSRTNNHPRHQVNGRFYDRAAKEEHYGSKSMMKLLDGFSEIAALANMKKNTLASIAKRDAQIIKALAKKGINEISTIWLLL